MSEIQHDGSSYVSPISFLIQAKSHQGPLSAVHSETIDTRHLANWTAPGSPSMLIAVWSMASRELRLRTARDALAEVESRSPEWRMQDTIVLHFGAQHSFEDVARLRASVLNSIRDELDVLGGHKRFHSFRRRVVLTDVYAGTVQTSSTLDLGPAEDPKKVYFGPGWTQDDLDSCDVHIDYVLASSLLMYEECWIQYNLLDRVLELIGGVSLSRLLSERRIVPFVPQSFLGFVWSQNERRGEMIAFSVVGDDRRILRDHVRQYCAILAPDMPSLPDAIVSSARFIKIHDRAILKEAQADLRKVGFRALLGLGSRVPDGTHSEAIWDRVPAARVLYMSQAMAVAEQIGADVVQYESGLSRLAAEKWYTELRFHRLYPTAEAFDVALRSLGVPDLGVVVARIGIARVADIASSEAVQGFRDWFWENLESARNDSKDFVENFQARVGQDLGLPPSAFALVARLKLAFFAHQSLGYEVGKGLPGTGRGLASRGERGSVVLARQAAIHRRRRSTEILAISALPGRNESCLCGSGLKFKHCCEP